MVGPATSWPWHFAPHCRLGGLKVGTGLLPGVGPNLRLRVQTWGLLCFAYPSRRSGVATTKKLLSNIVISLSEAQGFTSNVWSSPSWLNGNYLIYDPRFFSLACNLQFDHIDPMVQWPGVHRWINGNYPCLNWIGFFVDHHELQIC